MQHAGDANDSSTNCKNFQIPLISLPFMFIEKYVIQSTLKRPILAMYEFKRFVLDKYTGFNHIKNIM
jgi:hypothetical protein